MKKKKNETEKPTKKNESRQWGNVSARNYSEKYSDVMHCECSLHSQVQHPVTAIFRTYAKL